jgi:hypothetical protein
MRIRTGKDLEMRTLRTAVVTAAAAAAIAVPATAAAAAQHHADQSSLAPIGQIADDTPWGP